MPIRKLLVSLIALINTSFIHAQAVDFFVLTGANAANLSNDSTVSINPFLSNRYQIQKNINWHNYWGIGVGHTFEANNVYPFIISANLTGYFINLGQIKGIEWPFINSGVYDTLNYSFLLKSQALLAEARIAYPIKRWQPFILFGMGSAWNNAHRYQETPTNSNLSAATIPNGFTDYTITQFAYELSAGVKHDLYDDPVHKLHYFGAVAYQYFNLGKGQLGPAPSQTSNDRLQINAVETQGISFTLGVSI